MGEKNPKVLIAVFISTASCETEYNYHVEQLMSSISIIRQYDMLSVLK